MDNETRYQWSRTLRPALSSPSSVDCTPRQQSETHAPRGRLPGSRVVGITDTLSVAQPPAHPVDWTGGPPRGRVQVLRGAADWTVTSRVAMEKRFAWEPPQSCLVNKSNAILPESREIPSHVSTRWRLLSSILPSLHLSTRERQRPKQKHQT